MPLAGPHPVDAHVDRIAGDAKYPAYFFGREPVLVHHQYRRIDIARPAEKVGEEVAALIPRGTTLICHRSRRHCPLPLDVERLARDHGGRIRRIARRFAKNGAVDNLVQDILTRLWRGFAGFRGDSRFGSWNHRLALNAAMTHASETAKLRDLQVARSALHSQY
jgi:Sigma-70 region 2